MSPCPYCHSNLPHPSRQDIGNWFRCTNCNQKIQFTGNGWQGLPVPNKTTMPTDDPTVFNPLKEFKKPEKVSIIDGYKMGMGCFIFLISLVVCGIGLLAFIAWGLWKLAF